MKKLLLSMLACGFMFVGVANAAKFMTKDNFLTTEMVEVLKAGDPAEAYGFYIYLVKQDKDNDANIAKGIADWKSGKLTKKQIKSFNSLWNLNLK